MKKHAAKAKKKFSLFYFLGSLAALIGSLLLLPILLDKITSFVYQIKYGKPEQDEEEEEDSDFDEEYPEDYDAGYEDEE